MKKTHILKMHIEKNEKSLTLTLVARQAQIDVNKTE